MNSVPSPARRVLTVMAAALAGLAASVAFATPAAATTAAPEIEVVVEVWDCEVNGTTAGLAWDVINNLGFDIKLTAVALTPATSTTDFVPNTVLANGGVLEIAQSLPAGTLVAGIEVSWENAADQAQKGLATGSTDVKTDCPVLVTAEFTDNCDGTVTVKLINDHPSNGVKINIGNTSFDVAPNDEEIVENVTPNSAGDVVVTSGDLPIATHHWTEPENCPDIPNTGTTLGGAIGMGAGLVGVGAMLVGLAVVLRRRAKAAKRAA